VLRLARENPGWEIPQSWPAWIAEHWIGGCRRELWTEPSSGIRPCAGSRASTKLTITSTGRVGVTHRPHRSLNSAAPLKPPPEPVDLERYHVRRHARISGVINEYRLVA
jgi:hypothetical protein